MDPIRPGGDLPSSADGMLGDAGLLDELERWAADARVQEAALQRARERWLRHQATEDASIVGVLTDLAERGNWRDRRLMALAAHKRDMQRNES